MNGAGERKKKKNTKKLSVLSAVHPEERGPGSNYRSRAAVNELQCLRPEWRGGQAARRESVAVITREVYRPAAMATGDRLTSSPRRAVFLAGGSAVTRDDPRGPGRRRAIRAATLCGSRWKRAPRRPRFYGGSCGSERRSAPAPKSGSPCATVWNLVEFLLWFRWLAFKEFPRPVESLEHVI